MGFTFLLRFATFVWYLILLYFSFSSFLQEIYFSFNNIRNSLHFILYFVLNFIGLLSDFSDQKTVINQNHLRICQKSIINISFDWLLFWFLAFQKLWDSLRFALKQALGDRMNREMGDAWFAVFKFISRQIILGKNNWIWPCLCFEIKPFILLLNLIGNRNTGSYIWIF